MRALILPFIVTLLLACGAAPASAQAAKPSPTEATLTKDGKPKAKFVRAECKEEADKKGLKGKERREALATCFREKRPDLAKAGDCRKEGKAKKLEGKELRDFVKTCRAA